MPGWFIALEGGEGAGKTSAIAALDQALRARGQDVVLTREPGGTPEGLVLRQLLLSESAPNWTDLAELLLIYAARVQHLDRLIRPALDAGKIVLCDRYAGSSLAYQGAGRGLDVCRIQGLHALATGDFWPDLTLVLDVDPVIGLARSRRRLGSSGVDEGRFEALDLDFHARIRQSFLDQAAAAPERHVVIDAGLAPDPVADAVLAAVLQRVLPSRAAP